MRRYIYIITLLMLAMACTKVKQAESHTHEKSETLYTCSMHPQIIRHEPGTCPICGMELVPVGSLQNGPIKLTDAQIKLANISTIQISGSNNARTIVANGTLTYDQEQSNIISSRIEGRIEKLFVKQTGIMIIKGEPLYTLYSETLLTLEKEYLLAKDHAATFSEKQLDNYTAAAEEKLLLYGMTKAQLVQLSKNKTPHDHVTFFAPANGLITEVSVEEGQYINEGTKLFRLENLKNIWAEAELYSQNISLVKQGDEVSVITGSDETINGHVSFISPAYKENTQTVIVRVVINNEKLKLKPGMQVKVILKSSPHAGVTVPADAVIHDAQGAHVYVEAEHNTFFPKAVTTGNEEADEVEITDGLSEGDIIATTGAYLLHSESILKGGGQNK